RRPGPVIPRRFRAGQGRSGLVRTPRPHGKSCSRFVRTLLVESPRLAGPPAHGRAGRAARRTPPVARPRRLRHKLMLGLALVVGSVGLLLGGTLYGINAYLTTVKTTERKLEELQLVNILIKTLDGSDQAAGGDPAGEVREFRRRVENAQQQLAHYRNVHARTV